MSSLFFILLFITCITICKTSGSENIPYKCPNKNFTNVYHPIGKQTGDYCKFNNCVAKCCPAEEIFKKNKREFVCTKDNNTYDYSMFKVYKNDIKSNMKMSEKKLTEDYIFVHDKKFLSTKCSMRIVADTHWTHYYILEDGALVAEKPNYFKRWHDRRNKLEYCLEMLIDSRGNTRLVYHLLDTVDTKVSMSDNSSEPIIVIGMLVSSLFLLLTLAVYCVLPQLRNISGMIQMAYVGGLMLTFAIRGVMYYANKSRVCYHFGPLYYFFVLSNFLWLEIMSFNIWWTFRGTLLHRMVHRRGELVKFFIYVLCVYGTAGSITIFATVVDRTDLRHLPNFVQFHFSNCITGLYEIMLYMYIPIAILISINCILFGMTIYNIWTIKKEINSFDAKETRKNQTTGSSFKVYAKISIVMGVSWIIEAAQMYSTLSYWPYLILNLYNASIGIVIFFLLITERKTLSMLGKRFNIIHKWVQDSQKPSTNYSRTSGSSKKSTKMESIELSKVGDTTGIELVNSK